MPEGPKAIIGTATRMPIGRTAGEVLLDERLADDAHRCPATGVLAGKCPAADDRNRQRREIGRADHVIRRDRLLPVRPWDGAGNVERLREPYPVQRQHASQVTLLTPGCPSISRMMASQDRRRDSGVAYLDAPPGLGNGNVSVVVSTLLAR